MNSAFTPLAPVAAAVGQALQNHFIGSSKTADLASSFVAFRGEFTSRERPQNAVLHLFADARYLLWVNGTYALYGPARFNTRGPEYDTMDVTRFLKAGENSVVVLVMGRIANSRMMMHGPGMTLRLEADGKTALSSDDTWRWSDQTRYRTPAASASNVMDRMDARVEDGDWTKPDYDDSAWSSAVKVDGAQWGPLSARRTPLLRDTLVPFKVTDGQTLPLTLTAGQKLTFSNEKMVLAYTMLDVAADAGSEISLDYCKANIIADAGRQTFMTSDTFGFYGGSITVKSGRVTIHSLNLVERLYPFDVAGSFQSNDDTLNAIWAMCARSGQVMSEDAYVDCVDRERCEWMDCDPPSFDVTRTAMVAVSDDGTKVYADGRLLGAMLRRIALSVEDEGWVKAHTSNDSFDMHVKMEDRACDWVEGARRYYESTGDKTVLREIWPVMVRQMNYFLERRTERGLFLGREWEVWGNPINYVTCEGTALNAFVYKALVDAAYVGNAIGEKEQAAKFEGDARDLATAVNTVLWNEKEDTYYSGYTEDYEKAKGKDGRDVNVPIEGNLIAPTMFPALFALDQGIVPPARREAVKNYLFAHREEAERVMTFYYLFKQQYEANTAEFDREILQTTRSVWKEMAYAPFQVSWEDFGGEWSQAHVYGMFPSYFLSSYVLGVRLDGPVWDKRLLIEPRLGDLTQAQGAVCTEFGPVPVSWKVEGQKLSFRVQTPAGVQTTLRVPKMGTNASWTLDGEAQSPQKDSEDDRFFSAEVGEGVHQGSVSFTPINLPMSVTG